MPFPSAHTPWLATCAAQAKQKAARWHAERRCHYAGAPRRWQRRAAGPSAGAATHADSGIYGSKGPRAG
eukprot:351222-Chlamydomonas_euryale.AAC.1